MSRFTGKRWFEDNRKYSAVIMQILFEIVSQPSMAVSSQPIPFTTTFKHSTQRISHGKGFPKKSSVDKKHREQGVLESHYHDHLIVRLLRSVLAKGTLGR